MQTRYQDTGRRYTPRKRNTDQENFQSNCAQANADIYEKYSCSPLKQSMTVYNQAPTSRRKSFIDYQTSTEQYSSRPQPTPRREQPQPVHPSRKLYLEDSPAQTDRESYRSTFGRNDNYCRSPRAIQTKRNKEGNQNGYYYLQRQEAEGGYQVSEKISRRVTPVKYEVATPRGSKREANPLIEKSELVKQKIEKLSRMTPRRVYFAREAENQPEQECDIPVPYPIYRGQESPKASRNRTRANPQNYCPNATPQLQKEPAKVQRIEETDDGLHSISEMSQKIRARLSSIIARHG